MAMNPPAHELPTAQGRPDQQAWSLNSVVQSLATTDATEVRGGSLHKYGPARVMGNLRNVLSWVEERAEHYKWDIFSADALASDTFWSEVRQARRILLAVEHSLVEAGLRELPPPYTGQGFHFDLAQEDARLLLTRDATYGSSWKRRGGVGAFMVGIRKWDRILVALQALDAGDFVTAVERDGRGRPDGLIDDIRDLRRYLYLWEAERAMRLYSGL